MNISEICIRRPIATSLLMAAPRHYAIGEIRVEGELDGNQRHDVEERAWRTLALLLPSDATLAPGTLATCKVHLRWRSAAWWAWRSIASALDVGLW